MWLKRLVGGVLDEVIGGCGLFGDAVGAVESAALAGTLIVEHSLLLVECDEICLCRCP